MTTLVNETAPQRPRVTAVIPRPSRGGEPTPREAVERELRPRVRGPVLLPEDSGYHQEITGYNPAVEHHPGVVVGATGPADVMAAVGFATDRDQPVGVFNTGHGVATAADGAVLINTRRMTGVRVDPYERVAHVPAGARWEEVIHEAAAFGLAPLSGSSTTVGAVGYTMGGGIGLLGRAFGYAADHVRSVDIVTPHGALRHATPHQYADLYWAVRGGKGNFGVVTAMDIDLFPVTRLYGGGLLFRGNTAPTVINAYRRWVRTVPERMSSSLALLRLPWNEAIDPDLRGRFTVHVRVAYHGPVEEGAELVRPLREIALPLRDTVADMPYTEAATIHNDPPGPLTLHERATYLSDVDEDAMDRLTELAGPDSACPMRIVELRHLGGALGRPPAVPNAVGNRDAAFLLYTAGPADRSGTTEVADYTRLLLDRMAPWSTGRLPLNFIGAEDTAPQRVRAAYDPADYRRLARTKRAYDPGNIFRINHNIPPAARVGD